MADLVSDGNIRVYWVSTISNKAAPTTTELNAGTRIDVYMTPDGLQTDGDTEGVDNSKLSSTFTTMQAGRRSYEIEVTYIWQVPRVLETVLVYQASGYLVVRREVAATTAWTAAQKVEVYPVQCGEPTPTYGPNEMQRKTVPMFMTADSDTNATVA